MANKIVHDCNLFIVGVFIGIAVTCLGDYLTSLDNTVMAFSMGLVFGLVLLFYTYYSEG